MKLETLNHCCGHGDYRDFDVIKWDSLDEREAFLAQWPMTWRPVGKAIPRDGDLVPLCNMSTKVICVGTALPDGDGFKAKGIRCGPNFWTHWMACPFLPKETP